MNFMQGACFNPRLWCGVVPRAHWFVREQQVTKALDLETQIGRRRRKRKSTRVLIMGACCFVFVCTPALFPPSVRPLCVCYSL